MQLIGNEWTYWLWSSMVNLQVILFQYIHFCYHPHHLFKDLSISMYRKPQWSFILYWLSNTVHRPEAIIKFHHQSIRTQLISQPTLQTTLISIKNWNNWNFNMVFIYNRSILISQIIYQCLQRNLKILHGRRKNVIELS